MQRRFARDQRSTAAEEESGRRQCKSGVHDEEKWKPGSATLARGMGKSGCAIKFCKIISNRGLQFVSKRFLHWWFTLRLALQRRRWRVTSANGAGGSAQNPAARSAGGTQKAALALAGRPGGFIPLISGDYEPLLLREARCGGGVRPDGNLLAPPNDCSCACRE